MGIIILQPILVAMMTPRPAAGPAPALHRGSGRPSRHPFRSSTPLLNAGGVLLRRSAGPGAKSSSCDDSLHASFGHHVVRLSFVARPACEEAFDRRVEEAEDVEASVLDDEPPATEDKVVGFAAMIRAPSIGVLAPDCVDERTGV